MKPELLYLCPVVPGSTGNGMAMRAGVILRALAERHVVSLHVVAMHGPTDAVLPEELGRLCRRVHVARLDRHATGPSAFLASLRVRWPDDATRATPAAGASPGPYCEPVFAEAAFATIHAFRLTTLPYVVAYAACSTRSPRLHIDLDETESFTRRRLAALYRHNGDVGPARFAELEAELCERLEGEILARFDRVYVCSPSEASALGPSRKAEVRVLPNVLDIPEPVAATRVAQNAPFSFLFVGTLGFYQNEDAILYFCREVIPRISRAARRDFELVIVGVGATAAIRQAATAHHVRLVGAVANVAPWYRDCNAVVVPIRAAGGTRIKVLEAMAHRRPIVSTTDGIDGFEVVPDRHVLVGDGADTLAAQCLRLMEEPALANQLAAAAFALFVRDHTPDVAAAVLA